MAVDSERVSQVGRTLRNNCFIEFMNVFLVLLPRRYSAVITLNIFIRKIVLGLWEITSTQQQLNKK